MTLGTTVGLMCPIRSDTIQALQCEIDCAWYVQVGTEPDEGHCLAISMAANLECINRSLEKVAVYAMMMSEAQAAAADLAQEKREQEMDLFTARRRGG